MTVLEHWKVSIFRHQKGFKSFVYLITLKKICLYCGKSHKYRNSSRLRKYLATRLSITVSGPAAEIAVAYTMNRVNTVRNGTPRGLAEKVVPDVLRRSALKIQSHFAAVRLRVRLCLTLYF